MALVHEEPSKVESSTVEHADERGTVEYVDNIETIQDDNYHGLTSQFILIYIVSILRRKRMNKAIHHSTDQILFAGP
jgi:hypothetical protein